MARKSDIRELETVARELGMTEDQRWEFGDYVEQTKRSGERGSRSNGDFTYAELQALAQEFVGE